MKSFTRTAFFLLGLPTVAFFGVMTIPVMLFALPSVFAGNPLNLLFVLWWGIGGYGLYSCIRAILAFGKPNLALPLSRKIGIALGILTFLPLVPFSLTGDIEYGPVGTVIMRGAVLGLVPAGILLFLSLRKPKAPIKEDEGASPQ